MDVDIPSKGMKIPTCIRVTKVLFPWNLLYYNNAIVSNDLARLK